MLYIYRFIAPQFAPIFNQIKAKMARVPPGKEKPSIIQLTDCVHVVSTVYS